MGAVSEVWEADHGIEVEVIPSGDRVALALRYDPPDDTDMRVGVAAFLDAATARQVAAALRAAGPDASTEEASEE